MSQPPENPNPYESPHSQASEDAGEALPGDLARWARWVNVTNDVLVVTAAIYWLVLLSTLGVITASTATSLVGLWLGEAGVAWNWIRWSVMLVSRFPGQVLCGWMLGRFLRRFSPWSAAAGLTVFVGLALIELIVWPFPANRDYVAQIGVSAYAAQVVLNVLVAWAVVCGGAGQGRKGQQAADVRRSRTDGCPKVLSLTASSFSVGREEVHEIAVLHLTSGREIYTVDGTEKLNVRAFWAVRGTRHLSVGDRERHEVMIRWSLFPVGSGQAFVDGELSVEELFPESRLLFRVMGIVLAILLALSLAAGSVALALYLTS